MTPRVEFWFDFSCPYAYLASTRIEGIASRTGAVLEPRPMLLGGVFKAIGQAVNLAATLSPQKARHNLDDMRRWAAWYGVPLVMPPEHPRRTVLALRALLAAGEPFMPLAHRFFRAYWVDGVAIDAREGVAQVLHEAGHDADAVLARAESAPIKDELRRRTDEAVAAGVFGAPACVVDGELFWGQDRLDDVEEALGGRPDRPPPAAAWGGPARDVDFFFDYSSPFSYVAAARAGAMFGPTLCWRPMLLGGVFRAIGTPDVPLFAQPAAKQRYLQHDAVRQAARAGITLRWPERFPMRTVLPLRVTLAAGAARTSRGRLLIERIFRAYWAEDRDIADAGVLRALCAEVGLDGEGLIEVAGSPMIKRALHAAGEDALAAGVFGAPTFLVRGATGSDLGTALYWGADRLDMAVRAARGDTRVV